MKALNKYSLLIILMLGCLAPPLHAQTGAKSENIIAVYIYNFTKFLEWPQDNPPKEFNIYILGEGEITESLSQLASSKMINDREIRVSNITKPGEANNCQILFLAEYNDRDLDSIIAMSTKRNILTVSYDGGMCEKGIAINFIQKKNKIRFEINIESLNRAGITANTQLLNLAERICN